MKSDTMRQREQRTGWILVTPALIILLLVFAYPIFRAFWLSLFTQNLGTELKLVFSGFANYSRMLGDGRAFGVRKIDDAAVDCGVGTAD